MTTSFPDVPTVPAPPFSSPAPPGPRRRWPVVLAIALGFAVVILLLGTVIRLPYVIYSPGDATPVQGIVQISGAKT
jgi:cell division septal protein FtsQ